MDNSTLLVLLLCLPLAGLAAVLVLPRESAAVRRTGITAVALQLLVAVLICVLFDARPAGVYDQAGMQFTAQVPWLDLSTVAFDKIRIDFMLGIDGLSMPLVVLVSAVAAASMLVAARTRPSGRAMFALLLIADVGITGVIVSLDLFLIMLFLGLAHVALAFLIGGLRNERGAAAAMKFSLTAAFGGACIVLAAAAIVLCSNTTPHGRTVTHAFNLTALMNAEHIAGGTLLAPDAAGCTALRQIAFWLLLAGFALMVPMVPLHTWFADAIEAAPLEVALLVGGAVPTVGGYGILRVGILLFPDVLRQSGAMEALAAIAAAGVVLAGLRASVERAPRRITAHLLVAQMGFVLLGFTSAGAFGINGAIFQLIAHGLASTLLLLLVGTLESRVGERIATEFGGLARLMPRFSALLFVAILLVLGAPGLVGWWGLVGGLMGAFATERLYPWTFAALVGLLFASIGAARLIRSLAFGTLRTREWLPSLSDLRPREMIGPVVLSIAALALGLWPGPLFSVIGAGANAAATYIVMHGSAAASALNITP